jgi:hypothetical protein
MKQSPVETAGWLSITSTLPLADRKNPLGRSPLHWQPFPFTKMATLAALPGPYPVHNLLVLQQTA